MPIARVQLPDGRIGRFEVPEGTTPEQVTAFVGEMTRGGTTDDMLQGMADNQPAEETMLPASESISTLTGQPVQPGEMLRSNTGIQAGAEMAGNVPGSAAQLGKDIYTAVRHPVQTGKALGGLAAGVVQKAIPGEQEQEKYADAVGQMIMDRYGSMENFKKTAVEDPVGMLTDAASFFMAGGGLLKGAGAATKSSKLATAGGKIQKAAMAAEPINLAKKGILQPVLAAIPEGAAGKMYESAAKFSTTLPAEQRARMAQTALDANIMPTGKGVDKAWQMINTLNDQITGKIDEATQAGKQIDANSLFKYLDDIRRETYLSDDPVTNLRAVDRVEKSIRQGIKGAKAEQLTPQQAQQLKRRIYQAVNFENRPRAPKYLETAKKSVARAAKEELEAIYPELKNLNAREGALIELLESIQRSANRISNRDLVGIGVPIKGTAGGVVGGAPGAVAGILGGILDAPQVKARLAIALNKARKAEMANRPGTTAGRLLLQQGGRLVEE